jgi:hypothetical protein
MGSGVEITFGVAAYVRRGGYESNAHEEVIRCKINIISVVLL